MNIEGKFQIGKNGVTKGVINTLSSSLKTHNQIRITVLKSSERDKNKIKEMALEIEKEVDFRCKSKIIGFTIIIKRQSKKNKQIG